MKIGELRTLLTEQYGFSIDDLQGKKKAELSEMFVAAQKIDGVLDDVEEKDDDIVVPADDVEQAVIPEIYEPEWTDFVLKQFGDDETDNGLPKVDGLRRVAHKLLGVFSTFVNVLQCPEFRNRDRATVHVRLEFNDGLVVESAADVCNVNTESTYAKHAVATAESRAEGRALRKALRLNKVVTAEEMSVPENGDEVDLDTTAASKDHVAGISSMCKAIGIDAFKLAALKVNDSIESLEDLSVNEVRKIAKLVNGYRNETEEIPDNVKLS